MTHWTLTPRALLPGHPAAAMWPYVLPSVGGAMVWLRSIGVERGQRIGLAGVNAPTTAALLQVLPLTGVTTVLFNRRLTVAELENQVVNARLDHLIAPKMAIGGECRHFRVRMMQRMHPPQEADLMLALVEQKFSEITHQQEQNESQCERQIAAIHKCMVVIKRDQGQEK